MPKFGKKKEKKKDSKESLNKKSQNRSTGNKKKEKHLLIFRGKRKGYTRKSLNFLLGGKKDQITQILWLMHFEKKRS